MGERMDANDLTRRNQFSKEEEPYILAVLYALKKNGIPDSWYSIYGYGDSCVCMQKNADDWEVYDGERNNKYDTETYTCFYDACCAFLERAGTSETMEKVMLDFMVISDFLDSLKSDGNLQIKIG